MTATIDTQEIQKVCRYDPPPLNGNLPKLLPQKLIVRTYIVDITCWLFVDLTS